MLGESGHESFDAIGRGRLTWSGWFDALRVDACLLREPWVVLQIFEFDALLGINFKDCFQQRQTLTGDVRWHRPQIAFTDVLEDLGKAFWVIRIFKRIGPCHQQVKNYAHGPHVHCPLINVGTLLP